MEIDKTLERVKALIAQREGIDAELAAIFGGAGPATRKPPVCKTCNEVGHRSNACPNKPPE